MYVYPNSEARSCNNCCSGKAGSVTHSERVFLALGTQHVMCMGHIVICALSDSIILFHIIS